ncbi:hypothetical protein C922_04281 [Plasmodium inui San Antonio 1]|uniref:Uncharacterized protein n=1 Tax=Plasmodium inui San Antonio 1 TaxID=1237626 RepID=W7A1U1_9APIC|nr:hypothetical protein C922_04281 [Plasmodium inui San Antonio 1]EUD65338.1 hypothetical protein C922_04281 [Plasmodium inui San Antonio 1]
MLKYARKLNKKLIYKLHVQNDKVVEMPMFLVDNLYLRNIKELLILLNNAITFNRKEFLENYKRVLLTDRESNGKCFDHSKGREEKNGYNGGGFVARECTPPHCSHSLFEGEVNGGTDLNGHQGHALERQHQTMQAGSIFKNAHISPGGRESRYKYDNEEYDELITHLSEVCKDASGSHVFEAHEVEDADEADEAEEAHEMHKVHEADEDDPPAQEYSLIGYLPNEFFFKSLKQRVLSLKDYLSFSDLFSFIHLFSRINDTGMMKILGEQYIQKQQKEKDKRVNNKQVVNLLNIFLKLNYKRNSTNHIVDNLVESMNVNVSTHDLKLAALGFACLSRLNLYNMAFYCYVDTFLRNLDKCSHLCCSMVLHCLGYYKHYWATKRRELLEQARLLRKSAGGQFGGTQSPGCDASRGAERIITTRCGNVNRLSLQLNREKAHLIEELEKGMIDQLVEMELGSISEKSISSIFHFFFLSKRGVSTGDVGGSGNLGENRNERDHLLLGKLVHILITKKVNFDQPRRLLMCCYPLIIHRYFSNIQISSYFVMQCAKLIRRLKEKKHLDNLLFVLTGFTQNQMIFYQNRSKNKTAPRIYLDKKKNKLHNFKIENKYIDMLEKCEYEVNVLERGPTEEPVSCRSAILYIFSELTNLNYQLNKDQIVLYLQLFSSFDIKLSTDIKKKLFRLVMDSKNQLSSLAHVILQLAIQIYGISSTYLKTIALQFFEKMDHELGKLHNIGTNNEELLFRCIICGHDNDSAMEKYSYLCDLEKLGDILFVFDQIDIHNKDFISNVSNLLCANNFFLLTHRRSNFSSFVHLLHYLGSLPVDIDSVKKLINFVFTCVAAYVDLSYRKYVQRAWERQKMEEHNVNGSSQEVNTSLRDDPHTSSSSQTEEDPSFFEVDHAFIKGRIYLKDLILLLDAIRIWKAYDLVSLLGSVTNMINSEAIQALSDEDVELVNYIFIDMGLMNKCLLDEAR